MKELDSFYEGTVDMLKELVYMKLINTSGKDQWVKNGQSVRKSCWGF